MPVDQTRESWKPGQDWQGAIEEINYIKELAQEMGGEYGVARQHRGGRYTIRERIDKFLDADSFFEAGPLVGGYEYDENGDLREFTPGAFVMGMGQIDGRNIVIGGDDFTISGGSPHNVSKGASQFATPLASQYGLPYVQLIEGVGHSAKRDEEEGRMALPGGQTWWRHI
ncbi:MAG: methylmalonyl-CoA carboxyltransferase, partial [Chloroflexi bacterium]|nr:methylmalonyl-CoA carboxyltransferase [Chloroflexota bacterium]